jgi:hypothetical protein
VLLVAVAAVFTVMRFAPDDNLLGNSLDRVWVPSIIVAVVAAVRQLRG